MFGYFTAVKESPEGNMALFMALFIVCFVEVMLVKVITEEARIISRRSGIRRRRQFQFPMFGVGDGSDGSASDYSGEEEEYSGEESGEESGGEGVATGGEEEMSRTVVTEEAADVPLVTDRTGAAAALASRRLIASTAS